jgi:flavin reductase (DIM6/NTAB) family NADH-FMN oxidoreductase RutF
MLLDLERTSDIDLYQLATHIVTPRPIAWVTTQNADGIVNLAPFSYFGLVCDEPILLVLSIGRRTDIDGVSSQKDTARNLLEDGQAVVHVVEEDLFEPMVQSSASHPANVSEVDALGLATEPSMKVRPPRLARASVSLECVLDRHLEIGNEPNDFFILRAVAAHVADSVTSGGLPDPTKLRTLGKLGGPHYAVTTLTKAMKRP